MHKHELKRLPGLISLVNEITGLPYEDEQKMKLVRELYQIFDSIGNLDNILRECKYENDKKSVSLWIAIFATLKGSHNIMRCCSNTSDDTAYEAAICGLYFDQQREDNSFLSLEQMIELCHDANDLIIWNILYQKMSLKEEKIIEICKASNNFRAFESAIKHNLLSHKAIMKICLHHADSMYWITALEQKDILPEHATAYILKANSLKITMYVVTHYSLSTEQCLEILQEHSLHISSHYLIRAHLFMKKNRSSIDLVKLYVMCKTRVRAKIKRFAAKHSPEQQVNNADL